MFTKAKAEPPERPKRFYKTAEAAPAGEAPRLTIAFDLTPARR